MSGHDVVVCFGFEHDRIRRQPWHVAHGIASGLRMRGRRVTLLTDARQPPDGQGYAIRRVGWLFERDEPSRALRAALAELAPQRIFVVIGTHELVHGGRFRFGPPTFLVLAVQPFTASEFLRIPLLDLWRERGLLSLVLLGSMLPGSVLRRGYARSAASGLVFLSQEARARFAAMGLGPGVHLVPQVEPVPPGQIRIGRWVPTILYAGPPLALRGADLALRAFEEARKAGMEARLLLLLRPDGHPSAMDRFLHRVERSRWRESIGVVTAMLSADEMRAYQAQADVHLLPFRVTVSDAPLVVIEAGLTGRPVVVLDTPGVAEYVRPFDGFVARSPGDLAQALRWAVRRPPARAVADGDWTRWDQAVAPLLRLPPIGPARLATVALIGIDGAGKTTLAERLRSRLRLGGRPCVHVWSRFRNYASKPVLALARLTGHNRKMRFGGVLVGVHDFENWLACPFLWLQRLDVRLDSWFRVRPAAHHGLVVMDRCALDQLVDMAVDTGLEDELLARLAPRFLDLLPQPAWVVLIDREPLLIGVSRPDALMDPKLLRRRAVYRRLATHLGLPVIHNDGTIEAADRRLDELVGLPPGEGGQRAQG
ncbi:MAG TPA: glycosyltransferase [Geminicoccus sp.]|jgi:glycosyltransferase involved in cell wall biosynthesis/thymidylate kinase|uniref:glycosyltransferase n=1 Tax=Geminicoccus sp. TaxID=2024832 RepID=UPI002E372880|nr:glycosyltransferase [Geminicoccus sp.]HEX2529576.1 glycosyltransferase [Geminicoccus sp.]